MKKQNSGKPINRKISSSQMTEINPIKALIFVRVSLETLPTKGKINNDNNNNDNSNNNNSNSNNDIIIIEAIIILIQKQWFKK